MARTKDLGRKTPGSAAYAWVVLALLTAVYSCSWVDRYVLVILLDPIRRDMRLSDSEMGLLTGFGFSLFYAAGGLVIARMADRGSRRVIVALSLGTFSLFTMLSGVARGFGALAASRLGLAVSEAGISPAAYSLISDVFPRRRRGLAIALYSLGISLGTWIGLSAGGWLAAKVGWRGALAVVGAPGLALAMAFALAVREPARGAQEDGAEDDRQYALADVLAVLRERRAFLAIALGFALISFAISAFESWTPTYMMRVLALGPARVGELSGFVQGAESMVASLLAALAADRLAVRDPRWYLWVPLGGLALAAPCEWLFFLGGAHGAFGAYLLVEIGASALSAPLFTLGQSLLPPRLRALGMSIMLALLNLIGMGGGPSAAGVLSDLLQHVLDRPALGEAILATQLAALAGVACLLYAGGRLEGRPGRRVTRRKASPWPQDQHDLKVASSA